VADLFLDTHPYNAGTTASDALRMGLPVLTFKGNSYPSRMAASILNSVKLPELITDTQEEYESLAIELATNNKKYTELKSKLVKNLNTEKLFNTLEFSRHIESAYKAMYEKYHNKLDKDHIYINN
jgi:predicted O-linked N-acetylglucosamine transferase (SPINDLY family)